MRKIINTMQSHSPFDAYASSYDAHFDNNPIAQQLRSIVQQTMLRYFQKGNSILELNCGTGTDAIFLAHHGMHVLATDSSSGMIHKTGEKIQKDCFIMQYIGEVFNINSEEGRRRTNEYSVK